MDSNLYGAFPVKRLFWVVLTVFCSERERRFSSGPDFSGVALDVGFAVAEEAVLEKAIFARLRQPREERGKFLWPTMVPG
jgi:hypothetical protein